MDIKGLHNNPANTDKTKSSAQSQRAPASPQDEKGSPASTATSRDSVKISAEAKVLHNLSSTLDSGAPVNKEKVEALRAAIQDGSHKPNIKAIVDQIIQFDADFK